MSLYNNLNDFANRRYDANLDIIREKLYPKEEIVTQKRQYFYSLILIAVCIGILLAVALGIQLKLTLDIVLPMGLLLVVLLTATLSFYESVMTVKTNYGRIFSKKTGRCLNDVYED